MDKKKYNIAVVGATGNVGRQIVQILAERDFPINKNYLVASSSSIGKKISFGEKEVISVSNLDDLNFNKIDIAFFVAGSAVSRKYATKAAEQGAVIIDKSSFFRLNADIPLIVPEVNLSSLKGYKQRNIIASPNCCAIPLALALKPLDNAAKIKRVVISTYQSTSGAGKKAMDELYMQTKAKYMASDIESQAFPKQIAFNLLPQIGDFDIDGNTDEEQKIAAELIKILGRSIAFSVTCVRVPVFIGHSMSVNVEFTGQMDAQEAVEILDEADGVQVYHDSAQYVTPIEVVGEDDVFVSRIRPDNSQKNTINFWLVADNLRKGAALNAVQIAEELIKEL